MSQLTKKMNGRVVSKPLIPKVTSLDATEEEIREEICAVLLNSDLPQPITPDAFEFIDVNGKVAFVPSIKEGFEFNGRVVK